MCGGTVTGGENLSRNDEGRRVGAKVLEEVREAIEEDESLLSSVGGSKLVVSETHGDEGASEHTETHKLDRLASPGVDEEEGDPVSWDETGDGEDQVTDRDVVQVVKDLFRSGRVWGSETDGGQDDGGVETKTVEGDLNGRWGVNRRDHGNWEQICVRRERTKTRQCRAKPYRSATDQSGGGNRPNWPWGRRPWW